MVLAFLIGAVSGCGFQYPPPSVPDAVVKQILNVGDPVAVLSFAPGRATGKIVGTIQGWPFPQGAASQGIPSGVFTYVGDFKVTASSPTDAMPADAIGTRKVYFREVENVALSDSASFDQGQLVATDSLSISFAFKQAHQRVVVRLDARQVTATAFTYQQRIIQPPSHRDTSQLLDGPYSPDYGGYLLTDVGQ